MLAYILTTNTISAERQSVRADLICWLKVGGMAPILCHGPNVNVLREHWRNGCPDFRGYDGWQSCAKGPGAICCGQGHLNIWRQFLITGEPMALVFEDDAVLTDLPRLLEAVASVPSPFAWGILHHHVIEFANLWPEEESILKGNDHWRPAWPCHNMGSFGYLISQKGARALVSAYSPICAVSDHIMQIESRRHPCYIIRQPAVTHADTPSTIGLANAEGYFG